MSTKYLLPCPCGMPMEVERSQAGENLTCGCGRQLEVPTLRGLADLQSVETAEGSSAWTRGQGVLMVLGILVLFGGCLLTYQFFSAIPDRHLAGAAGTAADLDDRATDLDAADTLKLWRFYRDSPDLMSALPEILEANQSKRLTYTIAAWVCGGLSIAGGLGCIAMSLRKAAGRT